MKKQLFTIFLFSLIFLVGCGGLYENAKKDVPLEISEICESYGLQDVSVSLDDDGTYKGYIVFNVTIECSNFDSLSFEDMLELAKKVDSVYYKNTLLIIKYYISGDDAWSISPDEGTVRKNEVLEYKANTDQFETVPNDVLVTDSALKSDLWLCAEDVVKQNLKAPANANFCDIDEASFYSTGGNDYKILGYVDAQNDFGALLRKNFTVTLTYTEGKYTHGLVYFS